MLDTKNQVVTGCYICLLSLTFLSNFVIIPINVNLIASATCIVYIGSHLSLKLKQHRLDKGEKDEDQMTAKDAYMFPVFGSCMLFSLYILFKLFDKELINLLLAAYFTLVGTYSLTAAFDPIISGLFFSPDQKKYRFKFNIPIYGVFHLEFTNSEILTFIFSGCFAILWFKTKHFVLNNLFGIAFSIKGIEMLSLGSYKIGAILLVGLFFYDIFWVFGTDVMVTVATSFDAPIKLLFIKSFATATDKMKFSMLGLGDIVIPGIFIALLLRYDAHKAKVQYTGIPFDKPFFHTTLAAYVSGLLATVVVMYAFNAAQPALLYLVPACLGASIGAGLYRKEFKELLEYTEEDEKDDEKCDKGETKCDTDEKDLTKEKKNSVVTDKKND